MHAVEVRPIDLTLAKAAARLLATTQEADVNDAVLALICLNDDTVITGDVEDLARLLGARDLTCVRVVGP